MQNFTNALLALLFFATTSLVAQIDFKPAYYLDNTGNKTECLIKDLDWKSNPLSFEYKMGENDAVQVGKIENVQEFQIGEFTKYVRKTVEIDRWDNSSAPSIQKSPIFKSEILFLKVLVVGKANLYVYADGSFTTYFYNVDDKNPQQLIQKQYVINDGSKDIVYKNDLYKSQLQSALGGDIVNQSDTKNLSYFRNDFLKLFQKFNQSNGENKNMISSNSLKFHVTPRLGVNFNSINADVTFQENSNYKYDFGVNTSLRFGLELEAILPFNKGKWAIALEPVYTSYKADGDGTEYTDNVDYQVVDIQFVARHYMFINSQSRAFINAGIAYSINVNNTSYFPSRRAYPVDFYLKSPTFVLGAGYKYNKLSAELRYSAVQNVVFSYDWKIKYNSFAITLGYEIF